jgi:hypothetical protein
MYNKEVAELPYREWRERLIQSATQYNNNNNSNSANALHAVLSQFDLEWDRRSSPHVERENLDQLLQLRRATLPQSEFSLGPFVPEMKAVVPRYIEYLIHCGLLPSASSSDYPKEQQQQKNEVSFFMSRSNRS